MDPMLKHLSIPGFLVGLCLALICVSLTTSAQVIKVPQDQFTIQAALNAAGSGTTIQVEAGTYLENLIWPAVDGIRLVSTAGPDQTVLDGGLRGRVVKFGTGLTRATRLQGFTLKGGMDSEGAGMYVGSSPTIRSNRIMGCVGDDVIRNRGGGIFVESGASPLIEGNIILGNLLEKGKTNEGAGIHVADGACPEIDSNQILNNVCKSPEKAHGGGIYLGLTGTPSTILLSNIIAANKVAGNLESRGGGVDVEGGTAVIINNTISDNTCVSLGQSVGGGISMGRVGAAGSKVQNNILTGNSISAPIRFGGGIYCDGPAPALDFNDVWRNTGGDYFGCAPGLNDFSLDPKFLSPGDYHLSATSPCVDLGSRSLLPGMAATDTEGDPRCIDGNLDGLSGNGAQVDRGGDEVTGVRLRMTGIPALGATVTFHVNGPAGASCYLLSSVTTASNLVDPFGTVLIGLPATLFSSGLAPKTVPFSLPFLNSLAGIEVHVQGLVAQQVGGNTLGQLTNRQDFTLVKRFSRPIIEVFHNTKQMEPGVTSAAWTYLGQRGLYSTHGFGGGGAEGDLLVTGKVTLDSSARIPGVDGLVEWNFSSLRIAPGSTLSLKGKYPIRLNVLTDCIIAGTLDASGNNGQNAPPGLAINVGRLPGGAGGPGGGAGGDANTNLASPIGALPMELRGGPGYPKVNAMCGELNRSDNRLITVIEPNCGGGTGGNRGVPSGTILRSGCSGNGGGHATTGIQTDFLCSNIGAFGRESGCLWIVPTGPQAVPFPTGGTGGGAGGNAALTPGNPSPQNDIVAGSGGGGGGGVEIVAARSLLVQAGASILASGGNGGAGYTTVLSSTTISGGYGAGGAGGDIWLSGTSVTVNAGTVLSAVGGKGNPNPPLPTRSGSGGDGYIILRDLSGNPTVGSTSITPPPIQGRSTFTPPQNGRSFAYSRWYSAGGQALNWAFDASNPLTGEVIPGGDLTFLTPPGTGQKVFIAWQGAPDVNGNPDPNPASWIPAGNSLSNPFAVYENDIRKMRGRNIRHLRFRIIFELGPITLPLANQMAISRVQINY